MVTPSSVVLFQLISAFAMNVLLQIDAGYRHSGDSFFTSNEPQTLIGGRLDTDLPGADSECGGDISFHLIDVRENLRFLSDDTSIDVHNFAFEPKDLPGCLLQEYVACRTTPA